MGNEKEVTCDHKTHTSPTHRQHSSRHTSVDTARKTLIGRNVTTNRKESRQIRNPNNNNWWSHKIIEYEILPAEADVIDDIHTMLFKYQHNYHVCAPVHSYMWISTNKVVLSYLEVVGK